MKRYTTDKLQNLQMLRGLAAFVVFFYHVSDVLKGQFEYMEIVFGRGYLGVPIFFIISGFIITYSANRSSYYNHLRLSVYFFGKRLIRILPLYTVCTLVHIVVSRQMTYYFNNNISLLIKSLLFIPSVGFPPLPVGWTLNYEVFFYFLFAFCLLFGDKRYLVLTISCLLLVIVIPITTKGFFITNVHTEGYGFQIEYVNLITNPILLLFLLGVLIAKVYKKYDLKTKRIAWVVVLPLLLFLAYFFGVVENLFPVVNAYILYVDIFICGALVLSVICLDYNNYTFPLQYMFTYLGDISYSVYLIHPIVIKVVMLLAKYIGANYVIGPYSLFLIMIVTTIALSHISYILIERKATKYLEAKFLNWLDNYSVHPRFYALSKKLHFRFSRVPQEKEPML